MSGGSLEDLFGKLRQLFQAEYQRGSQGALDRIAQVLNGKLSGKNSQESAKRAGKPRAPRGSARAFIERVLTQQKTGASVPTIMAAAASPAEKSVSIAAIRLELYRGKKVRRYRNTKGKWSLPARAPSKNGKAAGAGSS
jgi:hypothetical protein